MNDGNQHVGWPGAGWLESVTVRFGFLGAGALLIFYAQRFWLDGQPLWAWPGLILTFAAYLIAFLLCSLAVMRTRLRQWQPLVLGALLFLVLALNYVQQISVRPGFDRTTDAALFADYAADLVLAGANPYQWPMTEAFTRSQVSTYFITPLLDGSFTDRVAYPALHILALLPFKLLGLDGNWLYLSALLGLLLLLYRFLPAPLRGLGLVVLLVNPEFVEYPLGGVTDIVWIVLLLLVVLNWRRTSLAAVFFGLACAYKQMPWLLIPFLSIRLLLESESMTDDKGGWRRLGRFLAYSSATFTVVNLPFILWNPGAWGRGILEPASGALIYLGSGLSSLTQFGVLPLPKLFYSLTSGGLALVLLLAYVIYFADLKHLLWLFPGIILWFSYRSLQSYFVAWTPLLIVAVISISREIFDRSLADDQSSAPDLAAVGPLIPVTETWPHWIQLPWRVINGLLVLARQQKGLQLGALGLFVLAWGGLASYFLATAPSLQMEIINFTPRNGDVHRIWQIDLVLFNATEQRLQPRFSVQRGSWQPYAWEIAAGPIQLQPGEWGRYRLQTLLPYQMFSLADGAQIVMTDASGDYRLRHTVKVEPDHSFLAIDNVYNQQYRHNLAQGGQPWGWQLRQRASRASLLPGESDSPVASIGLTLTPEASTTGWQYVALEQALLWPEAPLTLWVHPPELRNLAPQSQATSALMNLAYGLEFDDGTHRLWVLFNESVAEGWLDIDHYVVTRPAPAQEWSEQTVDLAAYYARLDWAPPPLRRVVRGDLDLLSREVVVRLLLAVRQAPPDTTLSAAFGPLRVTGATDVRARVAHTVDQPAAYFLALGDLAAAQRNHETAAYYYAQARQSAQQSGEGLADELNGRTSFQQAEINFWNGQYEQAAAAYSQAVAYGYRPAEAMKGMGWSWLALRNLDQAESAFRQAVMADPGLADAYVGLGWVMQARSDCTRAIEYFDRALTFDASLRDATLGVAQCQQSIAPVPSSPH